VTARAFGKNMATEKDKGSAEKVRISLDVSPEMNRTLDELASSLNGSKSDVLRKAIALIDVAMKGKEKKQTVGLVDENDRLVTKIIGL